MNENTLQYRRKAYTVEQNYFYKKWILAIRNYKYKFPDQTDTVR